MSKKIFLNVDGVLTSARTYAITSHHHDHEVLDPVALRLVAKLCEVTGATVIMATMWAAHYKTIDAFIRLFVDAGCDLPVTGMITSKNYWRRASQAILDVAPADPSDYVFLDDSYQHANGLSLITVNPQVGLTVADVLKALVHLKYSGPWLKELHQMLDSYDFAPRPQRPI